MTLYEKVFEEALKGIGKKGIHFLRIRKASQAGTPSRILVGTALELIQMLESYPEIQDKKVVSSNTNSLLAFIEIED